MIAESDKGLVLFYIKIMGGDVCSVAVKYTEVYPVAAASGQLLNALRSLFQKAFTQFLYLINNYFHWQPFKFFGAVNVL